jgi:hypothetical protein
VIPAIAILIASLFSMKFLNWVPCFLPSLKRTKVCDCFVYYSIESRMNYKAFEHLLFLFFGPKLAGQFLSAFVVKRILLMRRTNFLVS